MPETEIYISTDIETDGPIPGLFSMLSFASAAFIIEKNPETGILKKNLVDSFSANITTLPDATTDPDTMDFWSRFPEAWAFATENPELPEVIMPKYCDWLKTLEGTPIFVAYPLGFDFTFIYWYLQKFVGESPFKHHGLDMRSYAMGALKRNYGKSGKQNMPEHWFDDLPHTHKALDDAIAQGALFCNMLIDNQNS